MRIFIIFAFVLYLHAAQSQTTCNAGSPAPNDDRLNAVALIKIGAPINFEVTGFMVNHPSEDGRYWMITSAFPFTTCNGTVSLQGVEVAFHWKVNGVNVVTTGATLVDVKGSFALLELSQAPPYEYVTHLGVILTGTPLPAQSVFDCITHVTDNFGTDRQMELFPQNSDPNAVTQLSFLFDSYSYNCTNSAIVDFIASNPFLGDIDAFIVDFWLSNGVLTAPQKGKGSPLFSLFDDQVVGIFEAQSNSSCTSTQQKALFVPTNDGTDGTDNLADWFGNQNTSSKKIKRCLPFKSFTLPIDVATDAIVSDYILASSIITTGQPVTFTAGNYIELNPGFESNTNFEAEIQSGCTTIVLPINRVGHPTENPEMPSEQNTISTIELKAWFSSDKLMIETPKSMGEVDLSLYDMQGQLMMLPPTFELEHSVTFNTYGIPTGVYLLHFRNNNFTKVLKIIKL